MSNSTAQFKTACKFSWWLTRALLVIFFSTHLFELPTKLAKPKVMCFNKFWPAIETENFPNHSKEWPTEKGHHPLTNIINISFVKFAMSVSILLRSDWRVYDAHIFSLLRSYFDRMCSRHAQKLRITKLCLNSSRAHKFKFVCAIAYHLEQIKNSHAHFWWYFCPSQLFDGNQN